MTQSDLDQSREAAVRRLEGWDGRPIELTESLRWLTEGIGPPPRGPVGYYRFTLHLGFNMGTGVLMFRTGGDPNRVDVEVDYGVLMHRLVSVRFPKPDEIEFDEEFGPGVWRRTRVRSLAEA